MKTIIFEDNLKLSTSDKAKLMVPLVRKLQMGVGKIAVMNNTLWKNAVVSAAKHLKKGLKKKGKEHQVEIKQDKVKIVMTDEDFKSNFHDLIPHFSSYEEFRKMSEKQLRKARHLSNKAKNLMRAVNKEKYEEAMESYEEAMQDERYKTHPLYSRNVYWLYQDCQIDTQVIGWDKETKIEDTILSEVEDE